MAWNDQRSTIFFVFVNGSIENVIEGLDLTLYGPSVFDIDKWILSRSEDVAGYDHVRATEVNDAIAIGHGIRLPKQLDGITVVEFTAVLFEERVARNSFGRHLAGVHVILRVLVRHNRRALARIGELV